jgi:hypothetical protein
MGQHVFSWISGFGWTLMPHAPFRFTQLAGQPRSVLVQHLSPEGVRQAKLSIAEDGEVRYDLGSDTDRLDEVVELIQGTACEGDDTGEEYWSVKTSIYAFRWPEIFTLASLPGDRPPLFDLLGPEESRIWVQGPLPKVRIPAPEQLAAPGQRIDTVEPITGGLLVAMEYMHDGTPWRMCHAIVASESEYTCVVSSQSPARWSKVVADGVAEITRTLTPCERT